MKKLFLLVAMACALLACEEQNQPEEPQTPPSTTEPEPDPQAENGMAAYFINPVAWNGNFVEISNALLYQSALAKATAPALAQDEVTYPIISVTPTDGTWPIDLSVNYGDSAIVGADGLEHSGIMRIHATGPFESEGAVLTPTFENFKVYGSVLTGTQTITNTGKNEAGNLVYDVTVANGLLGNEREYIYSEHTLRELVEGLDDNGHLVPDLAAHRYSITGQMKMESHVDTIPGYEVTIDSIPMIISVGDLYPTGGLMHIALDQPIVFEMNVSGFSGPVSIQYIDLQFTGKTAKNTYGAKMVITVQMAMFSMNLTLLCELNEEGIVPESVQYVWE